MGESLQSAGRVDDARYCFARAVTLAPRIPGMLARAAVFRFGVGENREALRLMTSALQGDPSRCDEVFEEYQRRQVAVDEILRHGLPAEPSVWRSCLRRQLEQGRAADGMTVFTSMVPRGYVDNALANQYVEFLIGKKHPQAGAQASAHYAGGRSNAYPESNRVFNGDFEFDPTGSIFDWNIEPPRGAKVDFDRNAHYSGTRSLRIQFEGTENVGNLRVGQTVFLKPGPYRFRAHVRTKDLSTDEGVSSEWCPVKRPSNSISLPRTFEVRTIGS